jgi:hypothetical protein
MLRAAALSIDPRDLRGTAQIRVRVDPAVVPPGVDSCVEFVARPEGFEPPTY